MNEEDSKESRLQRALDFALSLDEQSVGDQHREYRGRRSTKGRRELADDLIRSARWKGAAVGFGSGLPSNPWTMLPAGIADAGYVLRSEYILAVRIALLFDENYLHDNNPAYELMIPITGGHAISQALGSLATAGGRAATKQAIKSVLTKETLIQFRRLMLKWFGIKVGQRMVLAKAIPLVGGVIGGGWNYNEIRVVGERVYRFFEEREQMQREAAKSAS